MSACSADRQDLGEESSHRLQWWLGAISWETNDRVSGLSGKDVVIAVIDTAIDASHPDLNGKVIEQYIVDGIADDLQFEHGTAVAGIICAEPHDRNGVLGIAINAKIRSIVISNDTVTQIEALIEGIEYAIAQQVDIINISAGVPNDVPQLKDVIDKAYDAGIIVVAASGNDLYGTSLYPANYDTVIGVNSVDSSGRKLYGDDGQSVFLPGGNIVTTYFSTHEPKQYVSYTGTSMSSPMVAGTVALLLEQNPNLTSEEIVDYFRNLGDGEFNIPKILERFAY